MANTTEDKLRKLLKNKDDIKNAINDCLEEQQEVMPDNTPLSDYDTYIKRIKPIDTRDATAVAGDILNGKTAYANGQKVTGNMPNNGAINITPNKQQQVIPAGYTSGGTVGAINNQNKSVTPGYNQQVITPDSGYDGLDQVTVEGDSDLVSSNIKSGVNIFGVDGTFNGIDTSDATATSNDLLNPKTAYVNGQKLIGAIIPTYEPSSETVSELINFNEITILDYIQSLGIIIYYKNDNTVIYFANVIEGVIDYANEVLIDSIDLLNVATAFKNVKMQINTNTNYYFICALLDTKTVLFELDITDFSIIDTPTVIESDNVLIFPNPQYRNFVLTSYLNDTSGSTFKSYLRVLSCDTKTIIYNVNYTDGGISPGAGVASYNLTGCFSPNGEMFIFNNGGFNRYAGWDKPAGYTRVLKFQNGFTSASEIKNESLVVGCFIDDNTFKLGSSIYAYDGTNVTLLNNNCGVSTTTIARYYVSNGMFECFLNNKLYKFHSDNDGTKKSYIYTYNSNNKTFTLLSESVNYSNQNFFYRNTLLYHIINNSAMTSYYVPLSNIITKLHRINKDFIDTSSCTAVSSDILLNKTAYANGNKITGNMPNNGALNYTPSDSQQSIPLGYTSGGTIGAVDITQLTEYQTCLSISESILRGPVYWYEHVKYLRWVITGIKPGESSNVLQASEFGLSSTSNSVTRYAYPNGTTITSNQTGSVTSGEDVSKLIDNSVDTKYCVSSFNGNAIIDITLGNNSEVDLTEYAYYYYYTANDEPNRRDPISWTLYASDDGTTYHLLDTKTDVSITTDRKALAGIWSIDISN